MSIHMGKVRIAEGLGGPEGEGVPAGRYKLMIDSKRLSFIRVASRRDSFLIFFFLGLGLAIGMPFWPGRNSWARVGVQFTALIAGIVFLVLWLRSNPKSRNMVQHISRQEVLSLEETGAGLRLHLRQGPLALQAAPEVLVSIRNKLSLPLG